jgi:hypothetical protein
MVSVTSGWISFEVGSDIPHSAQKRDVSGLDKRHFGHVTAIADPFNQVFLKIIKESRTRSWAFSSFRLDAASDAISRLKKEFQAGARPQAA